MIMITIIKDYNHDACMNSLSLKNSLLHDNCNYVCLDCITNDFSVMFNGVLNKSLPTDSNLGHMS